MVIINIEELFKLNKWLEKKYFMCYNLGFVYIIVYFGVYFYIDLFNFYK